MDFTRFRAVAKKYGASKPLIGQNMLGSRNSRSLPTNNTSRTLFGQLQQSTRTSNVLPGIPSHRTKSWLAAGDLSKSTRLGAQMLPSPPSAMKLTSIDMSSSSNVLQRRMRSSIAEKQVVKRLEGYYGRVGSSQARSSRWYCTLKGDGKDGEVEGQAVVEGVAVKVRTEPPPPPPLYVLYARLAKVRLGSMVVLSTLFGYLLAPGAFDAMMFVPAILGTSLTVASANSINQYLEVEYDSMMKRTKERPLPAGHMTPNHALAFGVTTGALGTIVLGTLVNPISATLAFANIILYTMVYTPMKRVHPLNTAVGAIVGAIPPLIGWAAQTGGLEAGAWVAFLVMGLWQMPHFHALSWPLRFDYGNAGYRMLVNVTPDRIPSKILTYTIATLALAPFASYTGLATPLFALVGILPSIPWIYFAYQFYATRSNPAARQAYKWSLYWLPLFFILLSFNLSPDRDIDTFEEDVIAIHQSQQPNDA